MTQSRWVVVRRLAVRFSIVLLAIIALAIIFFPQPIAIGLRWLVNNAPPVTPPPPVINAPQGALPEGVVGLQQWVKHQAGDDFEVDYSSGFLLKLPSGEFIGVTTAHSLFSSDINNKYAGVGLGPINTNAPAVTSDTYYGPPGVPVQGSDLIIDYVLLKLTDPDPALALQPDPRGAPQPGERVSLFSGLGDRAGSPLRWDGTVYTTDSQGIFILMDEASVTPDGMSGSPVLSQYTGKVVGMVIAGVIWSRTRWLIGIHPIGHLVELAQKATIFPKTADLNR